MENSLSFVFHMFDQIIKKIKKMSRKKNPKIFILLLSASGH